MTLLSRSFRRICSNARIRGKTTAAGRSNAGVPYPYPAHLNPTPHQIFHLPTNAPKEMVKARYYELVKIYHPDSAANGTLSPEVAEARFQAITKAYEVLRKGKGRANPISGLSEMGPTTSETRRRRDLRRRAELHTGLDERWKERLMVGALVGSIGVFVYQITNMRQEGMAAAIENGRQRQRHRYDDFGVPPSSVALPKRTKATVQDEELLSLTEPNSHAENMDSRTPR